jgi:ClpP class serine protease
MDLKVALSIYRQHWLMEPNAAMALLDFWEKAKAGLIKWDYAAGKQQTIMGGGATMMEEEEGEATAPTLNIFSKLFASDKVVMCPENYRQMADFQGFDGAEIVMIPISGPLMKADFCGWFGTGTLRQMVDLANNTASVHTIVGLLDTPGGTVDGTEAFAQAIKGSDKRTIGCIDNLCCSAGYWIGSSFDELVATSKTDVIGSIGTMCSFADYSGYYEMNGIVQREFYATASKDKNKSFNDARKGNGDALVKEMLDPLNDVFLNTVKENRGSKLSKKENVLTGKTYTASQAQQHGLIDGVSSFNGVIKNAVEQKGKKGTTSLMSTYVPTTPAANENINTSKNDTMEGITLEELKAQHPDIYKAAETAGVEKERARVKAWQPWSSADPEYVQKAIEEGKEFNATEMADLSKKALAKSKLADVENDSASSMELEEATTEAEEKTDEQKSLEANMKAMMERNGLKA